MSTIQRGSDDDLDPQWQEAQARRRDEGLAATAERWNANPLGPHLLTFSGPLEDRPHTFCPGQTVAGADCPNCQKPLLCLLSLQTSKLPLRTSLPQAPVAIHLLYCWTCAIPFGPFSYRIHEDGRVEILQYLDRYSGCFGLAGPYDGYTGRYPESQVGLRALSVEEQGLARQLRADGEYPEAYRYLTHPVHQVGGVPMIHNPQTVQCPTCRQASPFFATICDNAVGQEYQRDSALTFTGNSGVQMVFHWCALCAVMSAYHSCD